MKLALKDTLKEIYSVILKDLSAYGGFPFYGIFILLFLLFGDVPFAAHLFVSLVCVTAAVIVIRLAYFKPRPGMKKKNYQSIYERVDNSSFPSIHAARSVMLSFAFISQLPAIAPLAIAMILVVCLSRLHFRRHDPADIAAGLLLGYALSLVFF